MICIFIPCSIAAALCRLLFSTYKKNDVLSLMTVLDTSVEVLERRGYDGEAVTAVQEAVLITHSVQRILKEYEDKLCKDGHSKSTTFRAKGDAH